MSLSGKIVCFTGTLSISRAVAKAQAESAGAKVGGSVTKNTDYLVAGPGSGKKSADAVKKGVTVWTEEEFHAALKSGGSGKSSKGPKKAAAKKSKKADPKAEPEEDDDIDWSKLKVAELRAACSSRGLETGGTKAVLLARLEENSVLEEDWATYTVPQLRAACGNKVSYLH
jgi:subtilisin family serine protease